MFGVHSKKSEAKRTLVVTLGNGGSRAFIVEQTATKKVNILFGIEDKGTFAETTDLSRLRTFFFDSFKSALAQVFKSDIPVATINHVSVILSSPWIISRNKTLSFSDTKPFTVKQNMIDELLKASKADVQSDVLHESMVCYEEKTLSISLNGYQTGVPIGKEASSVVISAIQNFIASSAEELIYAELEKSFKKSSIFFHAASPNLFDAFSTIGIQEQQYLLFSIGDEITEIGLVRDGKLKDTVSLPKGKNIIVRKLGERMHATVESSISMLRLLSENLLEKNLADKVQDVLKDAGNEWLKDVTEASKKLSDLIPLPQKVFVVSPAADKKIFSDFLAGEEFHGFKSEHIPEENVRKFVELGKGMSLDIPAALEIIGVALK